MKLSSPVYLFISLVSGAVASGWQDFDAGRCPGLSEKQVEKGWISLIDGESLYGWRKQPTDLWPLKDGALLLTEQAKGCLRSAVQFDDFELRLDFKVQAASRVGVWIRTNPEASEPNRDGYKISLSSTDRTNWPCGSLVGIKKSRVPISNMEWNRLRIRAAGNHLQVWINDRLAVSHLQSKGGLSKGYVGLRHDEGDVAIRNVILLPLHLQPLLNGGALASWDLGLQKQSRFNVDASGILKMESGPGQIATRKRYGDFVFMTHVRTAAEGLNSGIFFRCIEGELMNGYESQIQNQFRDGKRSEPIDCGTGGIFRRQDARWVNAHDRFWWTQIIIADGATIAVWVNGMQVADWTDNRKPDANPRRGRRLEAGTINLQGHDPTTNIEFKNLFARELAARRR